MKVLGQTALLLAFGACAFAQQWEVGGIGGVSFLDRTSVKTPTAGSGTAQFGPGPVAGVFFGQRMNSHWGGEIRYEFFDTNLKLKSGGATASFNGYAHAIHYDLLYHTGRKHAPVQFFVAAGGGVKIFEGTGLQEAFQPLSQFGYFTQTHQVKAMASLGGGLILNLGSKVAFRAEVRDFISGFPTSVIAPAQSATYGKVLNDIVPMVAISYLF